MDVESWMLGSKMTFSYSVAAGLWSSMPTVSQKWDPRSVL